MSIYLSVPKNTATEELLIGPWQVYNYFEGGYQNSLARFLLFLNLKFKVVGESYLKLDNFCNLTYCSLILFF